jgi:hypothetical protein
MVSSMRYWAKAIMRDIFGPLPSRDPTAAFFELFARAGLAALIFGTCALILFTVALFAGVLPK